MRHDVVETTFESMSPELRALIAYDPNGALDVEVPQAAIDDIRRTMPVVRWEMGVGFFGMDDIVSAGRNPDIGSVVMGMGTDDPLIPLHLDGDVHRHYRKLLDPLFTPKKMAALEPGIRALADELIDGFVGDGHVELHDAFCVPLPSTIFLRIFGLPLDDAPFLISMKDRILKNEATTRDDAEVIGRAAGRELRAHLRLRLDERRAEGARHDDLLDQFMHFEVDGQSLDDDAIVNIMQMFTIAGLDTVTSSLSCIVAWFATHPEQRALVVANPDRLGAAIEEIMRYESPVPSSGARTALNDTEVNGVPVKEGELVYLCWASANLDPASFDRPLEADLDRAENRHIAFAAGIHRCLGSHLARAELRASIDQLHRRIPEYRVTDGDEIRYEFAGVRQARHLPLTFDARHAEGPVDFGLTEEQELLRDTVRDLVARTCPPEVAKAWDDDATPPADLQRVLADMELFGLPFPEEFGGAGATPTELVIVAEQLGHASLDVAMCYSGRLIPTLGIYEWGSDEQRARLAPEIMSGHRNYAVAISEPDAGSDAAALRTTADDRGDHFVVNGQKMWCTGAGLPDTTILMYVRTDRDAPKHRGISAVLVDPEAPGVSLRLIPTLARHILGTYEVFLDDVRVPKDDLVGPLHDGWRVMLSNLELERILLSAGYVGAAQSTLDVAVEYAKTRTQFDRPIGTFQSLAHVIADLQTDVDSARLLTYRAAWLRHQGTPCHREAAMAKLKGSETYVQAARWGMQILAGHGFATESVMSHRYRESIVATISGGTSQIQRNAIARDLGLKSY